MATEFKQKRAILIGVNRYENVGHLRYCRDDAVKLGETLVSSLGFEADKILTFVDGSSDYPPLRSKIFLNLGKMNDSKSIGEDDLLLFFFSGHGMIGKEDGKDYLLPIDATLYNLKETAIRVEDIATELKRTGCKNIVMFIDACREDMAGAKGVASIGDNSAESAKRAGIVTFFSCNPRDKSYEIEELQHGAFTYCILDAIAKGEANTVSALESYLRRQVPVVNARYNKPAQQPYAIIEPVGKGDLAIFFTAAQQQQVSSRRDVWLAKIGEMFNDGQIALELFNRMVAFLVDYRDPSFEQDKRTFLIDKLYSGTLSVTAFRVAWEAHERKQVAAPQTTLGRPT